MEMEKNNTNNGELEIDLQRLIGALVSKAWLIALVSVVCAMLVLMGTYLFVTPKYQAAAMFYVNNKSLSLGDTSASIGTGDISASRGLVESYIVILKTRASINAVIDYAGVNRSYGQVRDMISAESVDSTEIFEVVVTSEDPEEAEVLANAVAHILPKRIASIIEGSSAKVVDSAVVPSSPCSPNYTRNALIGFLVGLLLSGGILAVREIVDITIRSEADLAKNCKYPVLATIPDMRYHTKGSNCRCGKKRTCVKTDPKQGEKLELVGSKVSFAAAEAYKLLRTKLQYSFTDEKECRIIGVSGALHGEGKSLSSVNLAYTTAQLGKRVLLVDCDMRRPSLADKLPVRKSPGLSDFLTGQIQADQLLQSCGMKGEEHAFHVISSGNQPPNPIELLSSARMEKLMDRLRESYDYVIIDLPPVGEVGDALAAAKLTDGILIVVRQNYCDTLALNAAVRQFEFVDAKVLGVLFNCVSDESSGYGNKYYRKYYGKYYRRYYGYKKYGSAYDNRAKESSGQ